MGMVSFKIHPAISDEVGTVAVLEGLLIIR
jgi:hypothetical protein